MALLATSAAAALLGGCNKDGPHLLSRNSSIFSHSRSVALAGGSRNQAVVGQWADAYARHPSNPKMVLGYAFALKATGAKQEALRVLKTGFRANPENGQIAANLGRLALEMGQSNVAETALRVANQQGMRDWRTLSAEGTLLAKHGNHVQAQKFFLAAMREQPNAVPVINNLALSYALGGQPKRAETLLRHALAKGSHNNRVRQNLALVLGLEGKFAQAKAVASVDMSPEQAQTDVAFIENMVDNKPVQMAGLAPGHGDGDWRSAGQDNNALADASMPSQAAPTSVAQAAHAPKPVETASRAQAATPHPIQTASITLPAAGKTPSRTAAPAPLPVVTGPSSKPVPQMMTVADAAPTWTTTTVPTVQANDAKSWKTTTAKAANIALPVHSPKATIAVALPYKSGPAQKFSSHGKADRLAQAGQSEPVTKAQILARLRAQLN